jgi:hypothetical protein
MRTVLSGIHLFNDTILNVRHPFIFNGNVGEESKVAERQRQSVCVCVTAHGRKKDGPLKKCI